MVPVALDTFLRDTLKGFSTLLIRSREFSVFSQFFYAAKFHGSTFPLNSSVALPLLRTFLLLDAFYDSVMSKNY